MSESSKPSASSNKKRYHHGRSSRGHNNPKRGAPGLLLTCETGRERKCQHQGLEILSYYWEAQQKNESSNEAAAASAAVSLDQELAALKKQNHSDAPFKVYETGCRGSVFILCTLPGCNLIAPIQSTGIDGTVRSKPKDDDTVEQGATKKPRLDENSDTKKPSSAKPSIEPVLDCHVSLQDPLWDPIQTVSSIFKDVKETSCTAPSSRFVTRMIPIQATCFASLNEIEQTVRGLLEQVVASLSGDQKTTASPTTFSVKVKKRNCAHLHRDQIVDRVATVVAQVTKSDPWKVNLKEPDFCCWIEICKTLTGVSVLPSDVLQQVPNFNLAEIRTASGMESKEDSDGKEE